MTNEHKKPRQDSDMMSCSHCGKQWDVSDPEPPACTEGSAPKALHDLQRLQRTRRRLGLK